MGDPAEIYEDPRTAFVANFLGGSNLMPVTVIDRTVGSVATADGTTLLVPPTALGAGAGGLRVGVRPEDFVGTDGVHIYEGHVNITEALGEVTILYFEPKGGNNPVIAKMPGIHADRRHSTVRLTADPSKVHVFKDGVSLLYPDGKNVTVTPH